MSKVIWRAAGKSKLETIADVGNFILNVDRMYSPKGNYFTWIVWRRHPDGDFTVVDQSSLHNMKFATLDEAKDDLLGWLEEYEFNNGSV